MRDLPFILLSLGMHGVFVASMHYLSTAQQVEAQPESIKLSLRSAPPPPPPPPGPATPTPVAKTKPTKKKSKGSPSQKPASPPPAPTSPPPGGMPGGVAGGVPGGVVGGVVGGTGDPSQYRADLSRDAQLITSSLVKPTYTSAALEANLAGKFLVHVFVTAEGTANKAELEKAIGYGMDERVIDAVLKARYLPRRDRGGKAIPGWLELPFILQIE